INNSDSKIVITDSEAVDMILNLYDECPSLEHIVTVDEKNHEDVIDFNEGVKKQSSKIDSVNIKRNDVAAILYTSGTTGNPKGCVQPQSYYIINAKNWLDHLELTKEDRMVNPLPLFHMNP